MSKSYIAALSYSFFVGLSFLATKFIINDASSNLILAHRFTVALLSYSTYILFKGHKINLTVKKSLKLLPLTIFYPLLFFSFQVYGLKFATSSEAGIIFAMVPILVLIIGAMTNEIPTLFQIFCVVLSVSGVLVIFTRNSLNFEGSVYGLAFLFLSALSSAVYTLLLKKHVSKISLHELTLTIIFTGFIVFNSMYVFIHCLKGSLFLTYFAPFGSANYFLSITYLGVFASVGASLSSNFAIQSLTASQFSVFSNLSTLISIFAGALMLNEPLTVHHYIGSSLILIGVIGTNFVQIFDDQFVAILKKT